MLDVPAHGGHMNRGIEWLSGFYRTTSHPHPL